MHIRRGLNADGFEQVELIGSFYEAARSRRSAVHQMIMGAGKTTVIGPMLGLMLANGKSLVTQVVPKALRTYSKVIEYALAFISAFCIMQWTCRDKCCATCLAT